MTRVTPGGANLPLGVTKSMDFVYLAGGVEGQDASSGVYCDKPRIREAQEMLESPIAPYSVPSITMRSVTIHFQRCICLSHVHYNKLPLRVDYSTIDDEESPLFLVMKNGYQIECEATYKMRNELELHCTPDINLYIGDDKIEVHQFV